MATKHHYTSYVQGAQPRKYDIRAGFDLNVPYAVSTVTEIRELETSTLNVLPNGSSTVSVLKYILLNGTMFVYASGDAGADNGVSRIVSASGDRYVRSGNTREKLTADRSYYVRTDGNDGNNGLIDSAGGAFLTLNAAIAAAKAIDPDIYAVEIVLGAGTYTGNHVMDGPLVTGTLLTIRGATGTATDVTLHSTSGDTLQVKNGAGAQLRDLQLTCAGAAECLEVSEQGTCYIANIDFGACGRWHMHILTGAQLLVNGNYTISGDAIRHMLLILGGQYLIVVSGGRTCTLVGTRAFTNFFQAERGGLASMFNMSFVGSATGKRYQLASNAVVESFGGGASFFPGSTAGTTATGAYYN